MITFKTTIDYEEFCTLPLQQQIKIVMAENNADMTAAQKGEKLMKHLKKNNIKLGESVNYWLPTDKESHD